MKSKIWITGLILSFMVACPILVSAEDIPAVVLTEKDKISYENCEDNEFGTAFEGMAPGDSRTQTICLKNENSHDASFFLSEETLATLEEANAASGGAYTIQLSVGDTKEDAQLLLDTVEGGYESASQASSDGLKGLTALENYTYLTELASGESTNIYLVITLNGEGMDSTSSVDYSNALATLAFQFRAYYGDESDPTVITQIVDQNVPLSSLIATGDGTPIFLLVLALGMGLGLILFARKRRSGAK